MPPCGKSFVELGKHLNKKDYFQWIYGKFNVCKQAEVLSSSVYSATGHMDNISDFTCGIYIGILPPLKHIRLIWHTYIYVIIGISCC